VTDDAQYGIFRQWAGGPGLLAVCCKPFMRRFMLNVSRINQRNKHVGVQQECH
jgi:hypothetical protein